MAKRVKSLLHFGAALALACALFGCSTNAPQVASRTDAQVQPVREPVAPPGRAMPTKSLEHEDCAVARAMARRGEYTVGRGGTLTTPYPTRLWVPPNPVPARVGVTNVDIRFLVDSTGAVDMSRTTMTAIPHVEYAKKVTALMAVTRFLPAVLNGCAVEAPFTMQLMLRPR